jgi:starch phosphorylase
MPTQNHKIKVAYFSMEIGFNPEIPTYSGGLGILAGDTLKSAADLSTPIAGITLLYHQGYGIQKLSENGWQYEEPVKWDPSSFMKLQNNIIEITLEGRVVLAQAWRYDLKGTTGSVVPIYFLDTALPENHIDDQLLSSRLYGGDQKFRLKQEALLGAGGVKLLKSLGLYPDIETFHMNEGHAALLTLELLKDYNFQDSAVAQKCTFTTHTPIPAGHDHFSYELAYQVLGDLLPWHTQKIAGMQDLNMTTLALNMSRYRNAVAQKHGEVSRNMFPGYEIDAITNGVHPITWTSQRYQEIFNQYLPQWKLDYRAFQGADAIPDQLLWSNHQKNKQDLLNYIEKTTSEKFSLDKLTIGFARRAAPYKRASLLFHDLERLAKIVSKSKGGLQVVYAGMAHPQDEAGKIEIQKVIQSIKKLKGQVDVVYLENYNMKVAELMTAGVDVWLGNPIRPREASGTSGMKATLNGVLNFCVLDGWWIEGHKEDVTGWAIGPQPTEVDLIDQPNDIDADDLYIKLEKKILPLYYTNQAAWIGMMKNALVSNASFFNTHRMVEEYTQKAYTAKQKVAA